MPPKATLKPQPSSTDSASSVSQQAYSMLCDLSLNIFRHDQNRILGLIHDREFWYQTHLEKLHIKGKKLFHIDIRCNEIYWQTCWEQARTITKQCIHTGTAKYVWTFKSKQLSPHRAIEVLSKPIYNQLKSRSVTNERTLKTIHLNVFNDFYVDFDDFFTDLTDLINENLIKIYDGSVLKLKHKRDRQNQDAIHQAFWEWFSYEMTKFWMPLWDYLKSQNFPSKHSQALLKDIDNLFKENTQFRCKQGLVRRPNLSENQANHSYMKKCYGNESLRKSLTESMSVEYQPMNCILGLNYSDLAVIEDSEFYTYPHPQNYPYTDTIVQENENDSERVNQMRKSLKRPANSCHENCICLKDDGVQCPNLIRRVQCEGHSCRNSQIREKKGMLCWFKDQNKNKIHYSNNNLYDRIKYGQQLHEFHSFGIDLYTANILYNLMPVGRVEDGLTEDNSDQRRRIVENIIPYELSITQNLFQAVCNIPSKSQYQICHYEARVLEKKLIWMRNLQRKNNFAKIRGQPLPFPSLQSLNGYYMGLGVLNIGHSIPIGKFIGKFAGEFLFSWRQEQKQIVSTKHNKNPENQGNEIKFYCITVQSHYDEPAQPRYFSVDPQNIGNFTRSLNHSCDPNCKVEVMVSEGKYVLGVYSIKQIHENDQLTFDYLSVTDNYEEHTNSVCLCASFACRGHYLGFQDEIHQALDLEFLENQMPMKQRIKKLMKHCLVTDNQDKKRKYARSLETLNERQIAYKSLPQQLDVWVYLWLGTLNHSIIKEKEYLFINKPKKYEHMNPVLFETTLNALQKQKLCILNSKIDKIAHLFNSINDYSPPIEFKSHLKVLQYLEKTLSYNKEFSFQNLPQLVNLSKNTEAIFKKIREIRFGLLKLSETEYKNGKFESANYWIRKAFQFSLIQVHHYPNYKSQPVEIWMENTPKIKEKVYYLDEELYMIENLVTWPGQFAKIYKSHISSMKKSQKGDEKEPKTDNNQTLDGKFKGQHLRSLIEEVASQLQEKEYGLEKLQLIKNKELINKGIDFQKLQSELEKWIVKQVDFIKNTNNEKPSIISSKRQSLSKIEVKGDSNPSKSVKKLEKNTFGKKIHPNPIRTNPLILHLKASRLQIEKKLDFINSKVNQSFGEVQEINPPQLDKKSKRQIISQVSKIESSKEKPQNQPSKKKGRNKKQQSQINKPHNKETSNYQLNLAKLSESLLIIQNTEGQSDKETKEISVKSKGRPRKTKKNIETVQQINNNLDKGKTANYLKNLERLSESAIIVETADKLQQKETQAKEKPKKQSKKVKPTLEISQQKIDTEKKPAKAKNEEKNRKDSKPMSKKQLNLTFEKQTNLINLTLEKKEKLGPAKEKKQTPAKEQKRKATVVKEQKPQPKKKQTQKKAKMQAKAQIEIKIQKQSQSKSSSVKSSSVKSSSIKSSSIKSSSIKSSSIKSSSIKSSSINSLPKSRQQTPAKPVKKPTKNKK